MPNGRVQGLFAWRGKGRHGFCFCCKRAQGCFCLRMAFVISGNPEQLTGICKPCAVYLPGLCIIFAMQALCSIYAGALYYVHHICRPHAVFMQAPYIIFAGSMQFHCRPYASTNLVQYICRPCAVSVRAPFSIFLSGPMHFVASPMYWGCNIFAGPVQDMCSSGTENV